MAIRGKVSQEEWGILEGVEMWKGDHFNNNSVRNREQVVTA